MVKLDSILLFVLVIAFIMGFSIWPFVTQYWLFSLIFLLLISFFCLDLLKLNSAVYSQLKTILLWSVVALVLGGAFSAAIITRHVTAPVYNVHDIILQQEAAIRFLLDGKNPYVTTYFGTPLESWHYSDTETNPALYHFVMEPFYLLFALPFYFISNHTIGYFDGRIPLYILFLVLLITSFIFVKDKEKKYLSVILLAFNPAMLLYTLEGRSDMFMYAFLFISFVLLYKKRFNFSAIFLALACAVKQSAWFVVPFYVLYLFIIEKKRIKFTSTIIIGLLVGIGIALPFLIWNFSAFIDSTILYLSGSSSHSYPISGYGIGMVLSQFGIIKNVHDYFPFTIIQIIVCVPLVYVLYKYIKNQPTVKRVIISYFIFLFVFWYLSRYFNNSHLGFLSQVLITAYIWPEEDK